MNRLEIIEDTVKYYTENPERRALMDTTCVYTTKDGCHCAVGRYLKREFQTTEWEYNEDYTISGIFRNLDGVNIFNDFVDHNVKSDKEFWGDLQNFHDCEGYWKCTNESMKARESYVESLIKQYS